MNKKYQEYLRGPDWKDKRTSKRTKKKNCAICASKENLDVHHLNYKNLVDVEQNDLRVLCRRCHFLTHKLFNEGKIMFRGTNHNSRFAILKHAVKKELGFSMKNLFNIEKNK